MTLARNSLYTLASAVISLAVVVVTVPAYLATIGAERYGVLAIFWMVLLYAGQADFGLGPAVIQRTAKAGEAAGHGRASTFWSALVVATALSTALALLGVVFLAWFLAGPFDLPGSLRSEALQSLPLLGVNIVAVSVFGIVQSFLIGQQRFAALSASVTLGNSAIQLVPLACALAGYVHLPALVGAVLAGRMLGVTMGVLQLRRQGLRRSGIAIDVQEIRSMLRFGKWVMISTLSRPAMVTIDRLVIGAQMGALAVTAYTVPFQIAGRLQLLPQAIWQVMFARLSAMTDAEAKSAGGQYMLALLVISAPIAATLICLVDPLMRAWLGEALDERSILLARILLAQFWLSALATAALGYQYSRGQTRFGALLHLSELPIYVLCLIVAAQAYGLVGVAAVFSLKTIFESVVLVWRSGMWPSLNKPLLLACALPVLAGVALHEYLHDPINSLAAAVLLGGFATFLAVRNAPEDVRSAISRRLFRAS